MGPQNGTYYIPPKRPMQNGLENFLTRFGLCHFDKPKSHELEVLLTLLDLQKLI